MKAPKHVSHKLAAFSILSIATIAVSTWVICGTSSMG